jgi:hypothetical protein
MRTPLEMTTEDQGLPQWCIEMLLEPQRRCAPASYPRPPMGRRPSSDSRSCWSGLRGCARSVGNVESSPPRGDSVSAAELTRLMPSRRRLSTAFLLRSGHVSQQYAFNVAIVASRLQFEFQVNHFSS